MIFLTLVHSYALTLEKDKENAIPQLFRCRYFWVTVIQGCLHLSCVYVQV